MRLHVADANGIVWFDPKNEPFQLVGFEWISQDGIYRRLPVEPDWEIRKPVDALANHTAGGQVRFTTDSRRILVRAKLRERSGMYHMPPTGQSGFDLYVKDGDKYVYLKTSRFEHDAIRYEVELFKGNDRQQRDFIINFPLYNGVDSLWIGVEEGAQIKAPPPYGRHGKTVIYGTSITQGGCVARPGMAYSNILSRWLDMQFVNLGFSGNGKGEPALAHLINEIDDVSLIVLDYEANVGRDIKKTLGNFVKILRVKHPETPILIMSKIRYVRERDGTENYAILMENRDFQKNLVETRRAAGDRNIWFLDGSEVLGPDYDECTVDGVHPTDLGSYRIAEAMLPVLEKLLPE